ncbi:hypothetical protein [Methanobrevibacter sp.]
MNVARNVPLLNMLTIPMNKVLEKSGNTLHNLGDVVDGNMSGSQFWDYFNNEYKHAAILGPINEARMIYNTTKDGIKNGDGVATSLWNGVKNTATDMYNYTKQFFE